MVANTEVGGDLIENRQVVTHMESSSRLAHWCHLCSRNVEIRMNTDTEEVECQCCGGCFVEEVEEDTPGQERPQDFIPPESNLNEGNSVHPNVHSQHSHNTQPITLAGAVNDFLGNSRSESNGNSTHDTPGQDRPQVFIPPGINLNEGNSAHQNVHSQHSHITQPATLVEAVNDFLGISRSEGNENATHDNPLRARRITLDEMRGGSPFRLARNRIFTSNGSPIEVYITGGSGLQGGLGSLFQNALPGQGLASNIGDYAFGNLSNIINHLMQNDPNRHGAPPASKSVLESLPKVHISQDEVDKNHDCAVCKDMFEFKEEALRLPCSHDFHSDCILPWLKQHNSCPVCRHELPTDDAVYERTRSAAPNMPSSAQTS